MKAWLCALAVVLATSVSVVRADIPGPGPRPKPPVPAPVADASVPLVVEVVDGKPAPAKLVIPKKFAGPMKAAIDANSNTAVAENTPSRLPTVLAGIFLMLSLAFTGLWVVRSRGYFGGKLMVVVVAGLGLLAAGTAAWANRAPAPLPPERVANNGDRVVIELVEQGDAVKLILHKSQVTKMAGNLGGAVPGNPGGGIGIPAPAPVPLPAPAPLPDRVIKPIPNNGTLPVVPDKKGGAKPTDAEIQ